MTDVTGRMAQDALLHAWSELNYWSKDYRQTNFAMIESALVELGKEYGAEGYPANLKLMVNAEVSND